MKEIILEDKVNHPTHYADTCSLECIQVMQLVFGTDAVMDFCLCNAFKYMWRYKNKNGQEDLKKCDWYLNKAEELDCYGVLERLKDLRKELDDVH
jgi:hypothetical protein